MIRIFVSHSSKDLPLTREICAQLSAQDGAASSFESKGAVDLLVDYERLVDGSPWPKQLHEWLAKSHAGLVLLTEEALKSDWVLKEATILTWRQSLEERFKVFVAYDKAVVTTDALKAYRYGPLSIPSIQRIDSLDAATIAARVRNAIGPDPPRTLFEQLVGELTDKLTGAVKPNTLRVLAERLRVSSPAWDPQRSEQEQYIDEIARRLLSESLGGFKGVNDLIAELVRTVNVESLDEILDFFAPYWVDAEVAGRLRALTARTPRGAAALNTTVPLHSGLMYVKRAHYMGYDYLMADIAGGGAGQTATEIRDQIFAWARARSIAGPRDSDDDIRKTLEEWLVPVYAVLPERVDPDVLTDLRTMFKNITFVMSTGPKLDPDDRFDDMDWLQPILDNSVEQREHTSFNVAVQIINNKRGRR